MFFSVIILLHIYNNDDENSFFYNSIVEDANEIEKKEKLKYTDYETEVIDLAQEYTGENFSVYAYGEYYFISSEVNISYNVLNKDLSAEEYDILLKEEITRIYNCLKNKKIVDNRLISDENDLNNIKIEFLVFYNPINKIGYENIIGSVFMEYNVDTGFTDSYDKIINTTIITQEELDNAKQKH